MNIGDHTSGKIPLQTGHSTEPDQRRETTMAAVITISSGSRETGKSLLSANLALDLNHRGHRTGVLAVGGRQPLWGVPSSSTWPNVIAGRLPLAQILHKATFGVDMVVANGHGHALGQFPDQSNDHLADELAELGPYAYLIVDLGNATTAAAGACCLASSENILVLSANTQALTAGFEWLSYLARNGLRRPVNLILNQVRKPAQAQSAYIRFRDLVHSHLELKTNLWGSIGYEPAVDHTDSMAQPLADSLPHSKIVKDIQSIADRLIAEQPPENQTVALYEFWRQFNHHLQQLPLIPIQPPTPDDDLTKTEGLDMLNPAHDPLPLDPDSAAFDRLNNTLTTIFEELRTIRRLLESRCGK